MDIRCRQKDLTREIRESVLSARLNNDDDDDDDDGGPKYLAVLTD